MRSVVFILDLTPLDKNMGSRTLCKTQRVIFSGMAFTCATLHSLIGDQESSIHLTL